MIREPTRAEHTRQRDMVIRSLLLAPNRQDRSEERPQPRRVKPAAVVVRASDGHVYVFPTVNGHPL
jgi:hypothetical protein